MALLSSRLLLPVIKHQDCCLSRLVRPNLSTGEKCGLASTSIKPWPFSRPLMRDGPARRLTDQTCIFRERACPMSRRSWRPGLATPRQFTIVDQDVHPTRGRIDTDTIAVAHQRQRAADKGLR